MEEEKKTTYTEAQKRATKKYRETNKDKVNAQRKIYYEQRKAKDPEFLVYKRNKAKEYYQRMKNSKKVLVEGIENIDLVELAKDTELGQIIEDIKISIEEPIKEIIEEVIPVPILTNPIFSSRKRNKK